MMHEACQGCVQVIQQKKHLTTALFACKTITNDAAVLINFTLLIMHLCQTYMDYYATGTKFDAHASGSPTTT